MAILESRWCQEQKINKAREHIRHQTPWRVKDIAYVPDVGLPESGIFKLYDHNDIFQQLVRVRDDGSLDYLASKIET